MGTEMRAMDSQASKAKAIQREYPKFCWILNMVATTLKGYFANPAKPRFEIDYSKREQLNHPFFVDLWDKGTLAGLCVNEYLDGDTEGFLGPLLASEIKKPKRAPEVAKRYLAYLMVDQRLTSTIDLGIPSAYQNASLKDFEESQCPLLFQIFDGERFQFDEGNSYLIHGHNGRGKTHLMCAMAKELDFHYFCAASLFSSFQHGETPIAKVATQKAKMALDDISSLLTNKAYLEFLRQVIKIRCEQNLPTMATSIFSPNLIATQTADTNLASRLGGYLILRCEGDNRHLGGK